MSGPVYSLACLLGAFAASAAAQVMIGTPAPPPGTIRVDVDLVNVLCSVRDRDGSWARDLRRDDFELREDGKVRPVTHFAAASDSPLTVALMVDVSGSVATILDIERAAARRFLDEMIRSGDQALVGGFSSTIPIWQDLTGSLENLREGVARIGPEFGGEGVRARGGTLLYDAVDLISNRKLSKVAGRKTLVLITDGIDNGSAVKPAEAVQAAQRADVVIFAIHYVPESRDPGEGHHPLARLAEPTGGHVFEVSGKMPLESVFSEIAEEMRHQYSLGFTSAARDGLFHKLEVRVKRPGMKPAARTGYYAR